MQRYDNTILAIAEDIERYLVNHPRAADTAAGIQRCWLPAKWSAAPLTQIDAALAALVSRGIVIGRSVFGGVVVFSARQD